MKNSLILRYFRSLIDCDVSSSFFWFKLGKNLSRYLYSWEIFSFPFFNRLFTHLKAFFFRFSVETLNIDKLFKYLPKNNLQIFKIY